MSAQGLMDHFDPLLLARRGAQLAGPVKIQKLDRIKDWLRDTSGDLDVDLSFGRVDVPVNDGLERIYSIVGNISGQLVAGCQRCGGPVVIEINLPVRLVPMAQDSTQHDLPEGFEPLVTEGATMQTVHLVEDELLLALPTLAWHRSPSECHVEFPREFD